jgi:hypothetical protein
MQPWWAPATSVAVFELIPYLDAFCFVCILAWTDQSRKCPLCISAIDLLLHNIRSEKDFQRVRTLPVLLVMTNAQPISCSITFPRLSKKKILKIPMLETSMKAPEGSSEIGRPILGSSMPIGKLGTDRPPCQIWTKKTSLCRSEDTCTDTVCTSSMLHRIDTHA